MANKKMSEEEKRDWQELYEYVKRIMNYDENQALTRNMILRLKGLLNNKFMANKNIKSTANYSYKHILNTFKLCYPQIQKALRTNIFKDENHKFLYITKIVENNINDVYIRMKNSEKAKEDAKNTTIKEQTHSGAEFKPREKNKDKFYDLW